MRFFLSALLTFILASCSDNPVTPDPETDFFPINNDASWIYETKEYDTLTGTVVKTYFDTIIVRDIIEIVVGSDTSIMATFNIFPIIPKGIQKVDIYKTDSNIFISPYQSNSFLMFFPRLAKIGDTTLYFFRNIVLTDRSYKLKTKNGYYSCYLYKSYSYKEEDYDSSNPYFHYFAPGVGLVKFEQYFKKAGVMHLVKDMVLVKYY